MMACMMLYNVPQTNETRTPNEIATEVANVNFSLYTLQLAQAITEVVCDVRGDAREVSSLDDENILEFAP
jgi:hypothetical protein